MPGKNVKIQYCAKCKCELEDQSPLGFTKERCEQILSAFRQGATVISAAEAAGISRQLFYAWQDRAKLGIEPYASFVTLCNQARAEAKNTVIADLRQSDDWKAKAWWLERVDTEWQQKVQLEVDVKLRAQNMELLDRAQAQFGNRPALYHEIICFLAGDAELATPQLPAPARDLAETE